MNKVVCVAGMPGSGKTVLAELFRDKGYQFIRFGQVVLDEIIKRGLKPDEKNQKSIRNEIRIKYGMAAVAKLNLPKIRRLLKNGNVVIDGLYSWSEYKLLKEKLGKQMIVVSVFTPPELRYKRLSQRHPGKDDKNLKDHHFNKLDAKNRDYNEIENIEKGGPIAMADYTILNTGSMSSFKEKILDIFTTIEKTYF